MNETFGATLRRLRHDRGLTQERLAHDAGISAQAVQLLESGRRRFPRPSTVGALANALSCTADERDQLLQASTRPSATTLPAAPADFTGRVREVAQLSADLTTGAVAPAVPVVAITGMGGIGKTTLALKVAGEVTARFPDGQLLIDLGGFSRSGPVDPSSALAILLRRLGTPPADLPGDLDVAIARYRTAVAGRRMLIVLDNAADGSQVLPLLPGTGGSAVLVTSRRLLTELPGARQLQLGALSEQEAVDLLAEVGGPAVHAERTASERVVRACAYLPLAVRISGSRLAGQPAGAVAALADRLAATADLVSTLDDQGRAVRTSIEVSVQQLAISDDAVDVDAVALLPRLSVLDGYDLSARVVAGIAGAEQERAEQLLERLVDVNLLESLAPARYRLHDLVSGYFAPAVPEGVRAAVRRTALETYVALLWQLRQVSYAPPGARDSVADETWWAGAADLVDEEVLLDLLDDERSNLVTTVRQAVRGGADERELVVRLGLGMPNLGVDRKRWAEWRDVAGMAAEVATDALPQAILLADHGLALAELDAFEPAAQSLLRAARELPADADPAYVATNLANLAHVLERLGRAEEGLVHGRRALAVAVEIGEPEVEATAALVVGMLQGQAGSPERQTSFAQAVAAMRADGHPRGLAMVHQQISLSYRESGDFAAATAAAEESLRIHLADNAVAFLPEAREDLGRLHYLSGDLEGALDALHEALEGAVSQDLWDREASVRLQLGRVLAASGRPGEARKHLERALEIYESRGMAAADEARRLLAEL
ncbi:tetratricopeptide repeat protein [Kribbella sp. NPDC051770]|uniref:ATP-binding protein n=1 Tax=Kribbella sp. NPDC051770 TaxID=3155413 RepID=UPI0034473FB1